MGFLPDLGACSTCETTICVSPGMMSVKSWMFVANFVLMSNLVVGKNLVLNRCETCKDGVDYPSQLFSSYVTRDGVQYITGNATFSEDFGDNIMVHMQLFLVTLGNKEVKIFDTNERFCKMIRAYIGPFMMDMQKAAQMIPGACPIPKGKYHLQDFPLNINKILIKEVVPYGTLRFIAHNINTKTKKVVMCYEAAVEVS